MDRIIQSPGKYIQGADVINRLGEYLKPLAERWLVVGDKFVLGFAQSTVEKSFKDAGLVVEIAPFGGECSQNEIDRLRGIAETAQCGAILGIGGGKTLDTAKALAHFMGVPHAPVPVAARPLWRAASVPRRRWHWQNCATTLCWKKAKKRCLPPNSM